MVAVVFSLLRLVVVDFDGGCYIVISSTPPYHHTNQQPPNHRLIGALSVSFLIGLSLGFGAEAASFFDKVLKDTCFLCAVLIACAC